ncbi:MAG: hypothetical protein Q9212_003121 [Teloschistes hypoglaucus]
MIGKDAESLEIQGPLEQPPPCDDWNESPSMAASLETLPPELQAHILRQCNSLSTLYSLLRASPRLYRVCLDQKDLILSHVVYKPFHPGVTHSAWILAKASQIPQPHSDHRVWEFLKTPKYENALWFVNDYKRHSISFLAHFVPQLDRQQDERILYSDLSDVKLARIQRALFRFETFHYLFMEPEDDKIPTCRSYAAYKYLDLYESDELEVIACIRDYIVRRLWNVFESIENDTFTESLRGPLRQLGRDFDDRFDWFTGAMKSNHLKLMEHMMTRGLPFLQQVFQSEGLERAKLVISNSVRRMNYISAALQGSKFRDGDSSYVPSEFDEGSYEEGEHDFIEDALDCYSQGFLWANRNRYPIDQARPALKGLGDWGYVFWDKWRLEASGVLDKDPKAVAEYKFNDKVHKWSVIDILRSSHPVCVGRDRNRQVTDMMKFPRKSLPTNEYAPGEPPCYGA